MKIIDEIERLTATKSKKGTSYNDGSYDVAFIDESKETIVMNGTANDESIMLVGATPDVMKALKSSDSLDIFRYQGNVVIAVKECFKYTN